MKMPRDPNHKLNHHRKAGPHVSHKRRYEDRIVEREVEDDMDDRRLGLNKRMTATEIRDVYDPDYDPDAERDAEEQDCDDLLFDLEVELRLQQKDKTDDTD